MEFSQNNEENSWQMQRATYLSQNVKTLVCYQPEEITGNEQFIQDGKSDWFIRNDNLCKLKPKCM